jgi:RNA recognition motif-containing protein
MEMMIGGERYEMVSLPDGMVDTTLFVGNLCEFCTDDDLSQLFQTVSALHYVPACVVRKPNMASLQYGFVSFPTTQEKEVGIV